MIVTIDGGAGTGKTTVAAKVAEALKIHYFDTGALYRSFAWFSLQEGVDAGDLPGLLKILPHFSFHVREEDGKKRYFVKEREVTEAIRSREVTICASRVATYHGVRGVLLEIQRDFAQQKDVVFEGRDLGTVVFPHAEVKVFLTADPLVRAKRRLAEMKSLNPEAFKEMTEEELLQEMRARDERDSLREVAPLKPAADAYFIDTTTLSIDQVVARIVEYANSKKRSQGTL